MTAVHSAPVLRALLLAAWAAALGQGLVVPLLPVYANQLGASGFLVGCIFGIFALARILFMPVFGRLSDRCGRKPFITTGLFLYFLVSLALIGFPQVHSLLVIRFLQGMAAAMILPIVLAYAGDMAPEGCEGQTMGRLNAALALGLGSGPIIGGLLSDAFGLNAAFGGMGVVSLTGFLMAVMLLPPTGREMGHRPDRSPPETATVARAAGRELGKLWLYRFIYYMCIGTVWSFAPLMADTRFGLSSVAIGAMITSGMMVTTAIAPFTGLWADRSSKCALIAAGGLSAAAGMLVLACLTRWWEFYLASILLGTAGGLSAPAVAALAVIIGNHGPNLGRTMAFLGTAESSGLACGPVMAGFAADTLSLPTALGGAALLALLSTVPVLFLAPKFKCACPEGHTRPDGKSPAPDLRRSKH